MNTLETGRMRHIFPAFLLMIAFAGRAAAQEESEGQLYRWEDENGTVNFSSSPPPEGVEATVITIPPPMDDDPTQEQMKQRLDALNNMAEPVQGTEDTGEPDQGQETAAPAPSEEIMQERGPDTP